MIEITNQHGENEALQKYEELLELTASFTSEELLENFKINANRYATKMCSKGSVRLQNGNFILPEELALLKRGIDRDEYELL